MVVVNEEIAFRADSDTANAMSFGAATEGHTLIAMVGLNSGVIDPTISGSGWTELENVTDGVAVRLKIWWKVAGAGEPTSVTFSFSLGVANIGCLQRWSGTHATTPFVNDSGGATGSDDSVEAGSAGGSGADFLVAPFYYANGGVAVTDEQGYSLLGSEDSGSGILYVYWNETESLQDPIFATDGGDPWAAINAAFDAAAAGAAILRRRRME